MSRRRGTPAAIVAFTSVLAGWACAAPAGNNRDSGTSRIDPQLATFMAGIKAVDNHTHANSVAAGDTDADALPLDGIAPFELPMLARPDNPAWVSAYRDLYQYPHNDLSDAHLPDLRRNMQNVAKTQGDAFPSWVLDHIGTEILIANRIAMGPGLSAPRFRWASYVDPLMLPLTTTVEAATSPDRAKLFPLEDALLKRYLADLKIARVPATLDAYLRTVVTPTLEAQKKGGCIAVKFEIAYLRALDFDDVPMERAAGVYARYAAGGAPAHAEYTALQDFLFRFIAREAGRLGMAVHIHSFEGAGNYFDVAGADPLRLEPVFNDPSLRSTNFVIVHGGGVFSSHAGALLWKPNVYVDTSLMSLLYPEGRLAAILEGWIVQFPERVLFGSDAVALGPDMGWEIAAWMGSRSVRSALGQALTNLMRAGAISRPRAEEIAAMVLRTNASRLYKLGLK